MITGFVVGWAVAGYLAFGYTFAARQHAAGPWANANRREDIATAAMMGVLGYGALLVVLGYGAHRHGRLYPWSSTRWRA